MQIVSWNVASIRARLPLLLRFLEQKQPDIVFLQEIKATEDVFPFQAVQNAGFYAYINGQKGFNGVAVLSKEPFEKIEVSLHGFSDSQARFIAAHQKERVYLCVYAPNGAPPANNPADTSRLTYKLEWYRALSQTVEDFINQGKSVILGGDFNVIEEDMDVYDAALFQDSPLMVPPVRKAFKDITTKPLVSTLKTVVKERPVYSYWDFQMGAFRRNLGILLDYIFIGDSLKNQLIDAGVYKEYRSLDKPSDHAPVFCVLKD